MQSGQLIGSSEVKKETHPQDSEQSIKSLLSNVKKFPEAIRINCLLHDLSPEHFGIILSCDDIENGFEILNHILQTISPEDQKSFLKNIPIDLLSYINDETGDFFKLPVSTHETLIELLGIDYYKRKIKSASQLITILQDLPTTARIGFCQNFGMNRINGLLVQEDIAPFLSNFPADQRSAITTKTIMPYETKVTEHKKGQLVLIKENLISLSNIPDIKLNEEHKIEIVCSVTEEKFVFLSRSENRDCRIYECDFIHYQPKLIVSFASWEHFHINQLLSLTDKSKIIGWSKFFNEPFICIINTENLSITSIKIPQVENRILDVTLLTNGNIKITPWIGPELEVRIKDVTREPIDEHEEKSSRVSNFVAQSFISSINKNTAGSSAASSQANVTEDQNKCCVMM